MSVFMDHQRERTQCPSCMKPDDIGAPTTSTTTTHTSSLLMIVRYKREHARAARASSPAQQELDPSRNSQSRHRAAPCCGVTRMPLELQTSSSKLLITSRVNTITIQRVTIRSIIISIVIIHDDLLLWLHSSSSNFLVSVDCCFKLFIRLRSNCICDWSDIEQKVRPATFSDLCWGVWN